MTEERGRVYIDIESLLDTRQGFLSTKGISFQELGTYIKSSEYYCRSKDTFENYSVDGEYENAIKSGNIDILKGSLISHILHLLSNEAVSVTNQGKVTGAHRVPEIWINIYPFVLSETEINMMKSALISKLTVGSFIEIVSLSQDQLTPNFLKENEFVTCFIYDYRNWLDLHSKSLIEINIQKIKMYSPPIYFKEPTQEELKKMEEEGFGDGFSFLELIYSQYVALRFLPLVFYSNVIVADEILKQYNESNKEKMKEAIDGNPDMVKEMEELVDGHFSE